MIKKRHLAALTLAFLCWVFRVFLAADLTSVRYHSGSEHDRIVFDWSSMPRYNVTVSGDKRQVTLDFLVLTAAVSTRISAVPSGRRPCARLQTTSGSSDMTDAVAAVNATYFAGNGDAIGMLKIDGDMAGTTYFRRTALGIGRDGKPFMGRFPIPGR